MEKPNLVGVPGAYDHEEDEKMSNANMEYIPYSERNGIKDPCLGGLLNYLERVMGWDIKLRIVEDLGEWFIHQENGDKFAICNTGENIHILCNLEWANGHYRPAFREMTPDVFFRSYKTLLPVIRDLYSK